MPDTCWHATKSQLHSQVLAQAGGLGARSPAQARGRRPLRSQLDSLTLFLVHELCGNRESGLRPDTRTAGPFDMLDLQNEFKLPERKDASRWVVGLAGAGSIRGCYRV